MKKPEGRLTGEYLVAGDDPRLLSADLFMDSAGSNPLIVAIALLFVSLLRVLYWIRINWSCYFKVVIVVLVYDSGQS